MREIEPVRLAELTTLRTGAAPEQMFDAPQMPSEQMLETLADALSSLEYYLEAGAVMRPETQPSVLDLAAESVRALGMPLEA